MSRNSDASRPTFGCAVGSDGDVVDDPHAVPEPVGAAERDGFMDGRQPECLAGVNCEARVVASHVLECVEMPRRRVSGLRACNIEADDPLVAEPDGQFGDLAGPRRVPHRGDQAAHRDGAAVGAGGLLTVGETGQHGVDHRVQRQATVDVQFGREPHLRVDDVVGGQVLDALVCHPVQRLRRLHHPDRVRERFQVALERSAVGGGTEERGELVDIGRGQVVVAVRLGELKHRGRTQPAVQMVVQQGLRRLTDRLESQWGGHDLIRSMISGRCAGAASPTAQPPSSSAIAAAKRSGVSVYSVNSASPAKTGSPGRR